MRVCKHPASGCGEIGVCGFWWSPIWSPVCCRMNKSSSGHGVARALLGSYWENVSAITRWKMGYFLADSFAYHLVSIYSKSRRGTDTPMHQSRLLLAWRVLSRARFSVAGILIDKIIKTLMTSVINALTVAFPIHFAQAAKSYGREERFKCGAG